MSQKLFMTSLPYHIYIIFVSHIVHSAGSNYEFGNEASLKADPTANPGL